MKRFLQRNTIVLKTPTQYYFLLEQMFTIYKPKIRFLLKTETALCNLANVSFITKVSFAVNVLNIAKIAIDIC